jgi:putative protease
MTHTTPSRTASVRRKPEVMSPAGYWPQLHAAIEAGADAVYFGLTHFSARAKVGFTLEELHEVMQTLHRRQVRGFLTFNTLIYGHELAAASQAIAEIAAAGVDAIIVQDVGVAALAKQIAPHLEVHGSTQMSVTNAEGVAFAHALGADRVVLARELSIDEIRALRAQTDVELEVFVHGALCVSYSGQCFSSEAWGGRSANRGQCAQACRLPYELIVDGVETPLGDARYLLSPGDLYALEHVPALVAAGIASLKIEGRYKDAEYVALTTQAYRRAVDAAWDGVASPVTDSDKILLEQVYSRGLGDYFMGGTDHQRVVRGRAPRHRGVEVGRVVATSERGIVVSPPAVPLKAGDGVVFDAADWRSPEEKEEGSRIYFADTRADGCVVLQFGNGTVAHQRIRPGDIVWRTDTIDVARAAKPYIDPTVPVARVPLTVAFRRDEQQRLVTVWALRDAPETQVTVVVDAPTPTDERPVQLEFIEKQLGRLGGTFYRLTAVSNETGAPLTFAPSFLNQLRRDAVALLDATLAAVDVGPIRDAGTMLAGALQAISPVPAATSEPQLHVLVRQPNQLAAAIAARPASITLDYLELYGLKDAVTAVQQAGIPVRVATPRVLKPGEERILHFLVKLGCPVLVRGAGMLAPLQAAGVPLTGDFSLNAANVLSAQRLLASGLTRLAPTHDCNAAQIGELVRAVGGERIEVIAYHHLPVFHTEHCVFCRFLSAGTSYKDCGRPCEQHTVGLQDRNGRIHPVIADVGCRNTVFGAEAQEGSKHLGQWLAAGVVHLRMEFVHETPAQITALIAAYRAGLAGSVAWADVGKTIRATAPQGATEGSFFVAAGYDVIPLR